MELEKLDVSAKFFNNVKDYAEYARTENLQAAMILTTSAMKIYHLD